MTQPQRDARAVGQHHALDAPAAGCRPTAWPAGSRAPSDIALRRNAVHQRIGVEPAFADRPERAGGEIVVASQGKRTPSCRGRQQRHVGALGALQCGGWLRARAPGLAGQEQVARPRAGRWPAPARRPPGARAHGAGTSCRTSTCGCSPAWRTGAGSTPASASWRSRGSSKSRSSTSTEPSKAGSAARKYAAALPTAAPPTITTSKRSCMGASASGGGFTFLQQPPHHLARARLGQRVDELDDASAPCRPPCARAPRR